MRNKFLQHYFNRSRDPFTDEIHFRNACGLPKGSLVSATARRKLRAFPARSEIKALRLRYHSFHKVQLLVHVFSRTRNSRWFARITEFLRVPIYTCRLQTLRLWESMLQYNKMSSSLDFGWSQSFSRRLVWHRDRDALLVPTVIGAVAVMDKCNRIKVADPETTMTLFETVINTHTVVLFWVFVSLYTFSSSFAMKVLAILNKSL